MGGLVFLPALQIICHFAEVTIMRKSTVITRLMSEIGFQFHSIPFGMVEIFYINLKNRINFILF
jgi:hypothetical protein